MSHIDWRFDHARMTGFNIKNTQERLGTFPDGIIGSDTWNAIEKLLNERDELKRTCSKLRLQNKSLENDILKLQHKEYLKELEKETKGEDQEGCFFCKDGEPVECHNKMDTSTRLIKQREDHKIETAFSIPGIATGITELTNVSYCPNCGKKLE